MKILLLTTVLFITQVPAVVVPVTHKAVVKTLARVTVKQILTAICKEEKPRVRHQNRTRCCSGTSPNTSRARRGNHSGSTVHIYCFSGDAAVVEGYPVTLLKVTEQATAEPGPGPPGSQASAFITFGVFT